MKFPCFFLIIYFDVQFSIHFSFSINFDSTPNHYVSSTKFFQIYGESDIFLYLTSFLPQSFVLECNSFHATVNYSLLLCRITYQMFIGQFNLLFRSLFFLFFYFIDIFSLLYPQSFFYVQLCVFFQLKFNVKTVCIPHLSNLGVN